MRKSKTRLLNVLVSPVDISLDSRRKLEATANVDQPRVDCPGKVFLARVGIRTCRHARKQHRGLNERVEIRVAPVLTVLEVDYSQLEVRTERATGRHSGTGLDFQNAKSDEHSQIKNVLFLNFYWSLRTLVALHYR